MSVKNDFNEIIDHAHFWNWAPDWDVAMKVYDTFPTSFSILTPFAYSYLEEMIRSTTSEYGIVVLDVQKNPKRRRVGEDLINLAISENRNDHQYCALLKQIKPYFKASDISNMGDNRNSVVHGYMHPRFWTQESFERLIHDIASLSKYSKF